MQNLTGRNHRGRWNIDKYMVRFKIWLFRNPQNTDGAKKENRKSFQICLDSLGFFHNTMQSYIAILSFILFLCFCFRCKISIASSVQENAVEVFKPRKCFILLTIGTCVSR